MKLVIPRNSPCFSLKTVSKNSRVGGTLDVFELGYNFLYAIAEFD